MRHTPCNLQNYTNLDKFKNNIKKNCLLVPSKVRKVFEEHLDRFICIKGFEELGNIISMEFSLSN